MPIDYKKYPPDWKEIRQRILKRAGNKCEFCGLENGQMVHRVYPNGFEKDIRVVLTIAHLDHDEENWDVSDDRLKALCQKCHITYDKQEKVRRVRAKYFPHLLK